MFCLAGVGGRLPDFVQKAISAGKVLAIDGCDKDCARQTLQSAGCSGFQHVRVTDLGLEKGKSPVNDDNVAQVAARGAAAIL